MVTLSQVQSGLAKYIDNEILAKVAGWKKWTFGAFSGMVLSKSATVFNQIKSMQFVKMLEIVDENDNIDIDTLYTHFLTQAEKGAVTFDVPTLGAMTLTKADIEKLYQYITQE